VLLLTIIDVDGKLLMVVFIIDVIIDLIDCCCIVDYWYCIVVGIVDVIVVVD